MTPSSGVIARLHAAYLAPVPAERLAVVRLLVGGFAVIYLQQRWGLLLRTLKMDASGFAPIGVVSVLNEPLPPSLAMAVYLGALASGVAFTLGYRYRYSAPIFAVLLLWVTTYRSSWGMIFHSENLLFWHVAILSTCHAEQALSLDARSRVAARTSSSVALPAAVIAEG